jgi:DNA-binding transcriptional regulator YiaG
MNATESVHQLIGLLAGRRQDLARELGITYATLYAWESGRRKPRAAQLKRMVEVAEARITEIQKSVLHLLEACQE